MRKEVYDELERIVVKGAKEDYFFFEIGAGAVGIFLTLAMFLLTSNLPALVITATGLTIFVIAYIPYDKQMQEKLQKRKDMMEELKKEVK
jgi:uncharacterized membrane protein (DUF106 family)